MTRVEFYDPQFVPVSRLTYSVIAARYLGKWMFVRHVMRDTWEIPGGHIEDCESSDAAARRELNEETGALVFDLQCVATYSVTINRSTGWGRLYFAEVKETGPVRDISEIEEVLYQTVIPGQLTYPDIQPNLFLKVLEYVKKIDNIPG